MELHLSQKNFWVIFNRMELRAYMTSMIIVVSVLCVSIFTKLMNYNVHSAFSNDHLKQARVLVKQALQWHTMAMQDSNPLFAMRHSDYAVAYLTAARSMLPDQILEKISNVEIHEMVHTLEQEQRENATQLTQKCPRANPEKVTNSVKWLS